MEMTKALKLNEFPEFASVVQLIAAKGDEKGAEKFVRGLAPAYFSQRLVPDHFMSNERDLDGDLNLGALAGSEIQYGLTREELVRHTFISGQSGSGKSNLLKRIFLQAKTAGIHTIHVDRKGDLEHTARQGVLSIHWSQLRLNPLSPFRGASGANLHEYRNEFAKLFADLMQFFQRGHAVFLLGLTELYESKEVAQGKPFPILEDLLSLFKSADFRKKVRGQGMESVLSIADKLESIVVELGTIVECEQGFDFPALLDAGEAVNINLDGISVEYQNFLIVVLMLQYSHWFKVHGPRNQLNMLLMFDEAKGLLGKQQGNFTIKDLVSKVRELGIGLVCADQIPSEISQFLFSNIGTLVMFRHSDGMDLQRLRYSLGCSIEQIAENYTLKPGEAIVRRMKCKDLHKVVVPFEPAEKFIEREELNRLVAGRLEELGRSVVFPAAPPQMPQADEAERQFMAAVLRDFERPASEIYKELGLGESAGFRLKQKLVSKGAISQVETNLGKGGKRAVFLVPSPELVSSDSSGKGGVLHRHFQRSIAEGLRAKGWDCELEVNDVDVSATKDGASVGIQVCITSKPKAEAEAVGKVLDHHDRCLIAFASSASLQKTEAQIPKEARQRVSLCLLTNVMERLS